MSKSEEVERQESLDTAGRPTGYLCSFTVVTVSNEQIHQTVSRLTPNSLRTQISVATVG
jgi:hypothetical protein